MPPTPNSSHHYVFVKNILRYWRCKVINVMLCHVVSCLFVAGLQNLWTAAVQRQAVALALSWFHDQLLACISTLEAMQTWLSKTSMDETCFLVLMSLDCSFPLRGSCAGFTAFGETHNLPVDPIDASWMHHERALSKPNQSWHWCKRSMVIRILSSWLWLSCQSFKTKTISGYQQPTFFALASCCWTAKAEINEYYLFHGPCLKLCTFCDCAGNRTRTSRKGLPWRHKPYI